MTSQSPRIYIYKITFEEVLYYYYGVHKEKKYNEYYMGTPVTHKWCWDFYAPKKQILEIFDYTDEGWLKAQEVEKRLIRPVYNTDKWCLNESCGWKVSLKISSESGKKIARHNKINGLGIFGMTSDELSLAGKKGGNIVYENKQGVFNMSEEDRIKASKKGGNKCRELNIGVCGLSNEQLSNAGKKGGSTTRKLNLGIFSWTKEQRSQHSKKISNQKWICLETGFISNASGLTRYQRKRGIDTCKREKIS